MSFKKHYKVLPMLYVWLLSTLPYFIIVLVPRKPIGWFVERPSVLWWFGWGMLSSTNNENSAYSTQLRRSNKAGGFNKKKGLNVVDANAVVPEVYAGKPLGNEIGCCETETYLPPSEDGSF